MSTLHLMLTPLHTTECYSSGFSCLPCLLFSIVSTFRFASPLSFNTILSPLKPRQHVFLQWFSVCTLYIATLCWIKGAICNGWQEGQWAKVGCNHSQTAAPLPAARLIQWIFHASCLNCWQQRGGRLGIMAAHSHSKCSFPECRLGGVPPLHQ